MFGRFFERSSQALRISPRSAIVSKPRFRIIPPMRGRGIVSVWALALLAQAGGCSSDDCTASGTCAPAASADAGAGAVAPSTDFELQPITIASIQQGATAKVPISLRRAPTNAEPIAVSVEGLPSGITVDSLEIPAAENEELLVLHVAADAKQGPIELTVNAKAKDTVKTAKLSTNVRGKPGAIDTSFGDGGKLSILAGHAEEVRSVLIGPNDEIYAVGSCPTVCVVKLSAAGVLDPSYGGFDNRMPELAYAPASFLDSAGRVVVAGGAVSPLSKPRLARFDTSGKPDASVGIISLETGLPNWTFASSVESMGPCSDGSFYATFYLQGPQVMRFTSAFALDTQFSGDGLEPATAIKGNAAVVCQSDGDALLSGRTASASGFMRLLRSGVFDTSIGANGVKELPSLGFEYLGMPPVPFPDGRIVSVFDADNTVSLVRTLYNHVLDTSFGAQGIATITKAGAGISLENFIVDKTGKLILSLREVDVETVIRLFPDGNKDTSFGEAGVVRTLSPGTTRVSVGAQSDGKIVVVSTNETTHTWVASRLWP